MFTFFDIEVYRYDWLIVLLTDDNQIIKVHNDVEALKKRLSTKNILVGYNNYNYDDLILSSILMGRNHEQIYKLSQAIISGKRPRVKALPYLTLDVMQEVKLNLSLKEAQANMGLNIVETPIDFNLDRPLKEMEIEYVFRYCENDVRTTKELFEKREAYFTSKFEIVQTFKLKPIEVKKTETNLSAAVLKAKKRKPDEDRLLIQFDKRLKKNEIPKPIINFYEDIKNQYEQGADYQQLESQKFDYTLGGIQHTFGFGGLHGARENFIHKGNMMQIDVSSYYPTLMINNNFVSRAAESPDLYKQIYDERLRLKAKDDPKQEIYKLILNKVSGAMKSEYNALYDPLMNNNIVVNGQLILTHLIILLEPFAELIQSNTDGIIISYDLEMKDNILQLIQLFSKHYELQFDVDYISKIAQRDVNNYVIEYENGEVKAKGRMTYFEGGNWERNSLAIIDKALVDYYIHGIDVQKTVINAWKDNKLDLFQLVAKTGKNFTQMVHEVDGNMKPIQKVNRVFATNNKRLGSVYKEKDGKYMKVQYASEHCLVFNDDLRKMNKRYIDLNYYIKLIKSNLF
jgi:hypothetical protein